MKFLIRSVLFFGIAVMFTRPPVFAGNYGDGQYGAGLYNIGQEQPTSQATPTPTPTPEQVEEGEEIVLNEFPEFENGSVQGKSFNVKIGNIFHFLVKEISHTVTVTAITENSVTITIASEPQIVTLTVNETKEFDVDGDMVADIRIALTSIIDSVPTLTFSKVLAQSEQPEVTTTPTVTPSQTAVPQGQTTKSNSWIWWLLLIFIIVVILYFALRRKR